jgi:hypothetical protein
VLGVVVVVVVVVVVIFIVAAVGALDEDFTVVVVAVTILTPHPSDCSQNGKIRNKNNNNEILFLSPVFR